MLKNRYRSREDKLRNLLLDELKSKTPKVENLVTIVNEFEKDNLNSIEKLKRGKKVEMNRIKGALKQSINAHGVITKELVGSASKRIYGAIMEDENVSVNKTRNLLMLVGISLVIGLLIGLMF